MVWRLWPPADVSPQGGGLALMRSFNFIDPAAHVTSVNVRLTYSDGSIQDVVCVDPEVALKLCGAPPHGFLIIAPKYHWGVREKPRNTMQDRLAALMQEPCKHCGLPWSQCGDAPAAEPLSQAKGVGRCERCGTDGVPGSGCERGVVEDRG